MAVAVDYDYDASYFIYTSRITVICRLQDSLASADKIRMSFTFTFRDLCVKALKLKKLKDICVLSVDVDAICYLAYPLDVDDDE